MFKWFHRDKVDKPAATQPPESVAAPPTEFVDPAMAWAAALGERVAHFDAPTEVAPTVDLATGSNSAPTAALTHEESFAAALADAVVHVVAAEPAVVLESAPESAAPVAELPAAALGAPAWHEPVPVADPAPAWSDEYPVTAVGAAAGRDDGRAVADSTFESVPALFDSEAPTPEAAKPRTLRERLAATARALTASVGSLFKRNPKLDEDLLEELETALIQADVGVMASTELVAKLGARMRKREFADAQALLAALRADLRGLIANYARPLNIPPAPRPFVILTVGVNGAGKTTTIGKLAMRYKQAGYSVMLAAGDTFRAAAVEQLKTWGDRNQVAVVAQGSGADSASVIFDALQAARSRNIDVLIADTAGRLHTQGHLMQELAKVKRVLGKIDPSAPHETLLVIDGGTGQNALNQAKQFHQAVGLNGIVVTKLDGTAKGGMVFALCRELGLPIRFIGVGEKREDLREFVAEDFVDALLPRELGG